MHPREIPKRVQSRRKTQPRLATGKALQQRLGLFWGLTRRAGAPKGAGVLRHLPRRQPWLRVAPTPAPLATPARVHSTTYHALKRRRAASDRGECLVQIFQQIVDVLDADRQADHAFRYAGLGQLLRVELAVRGRSRMAGERLGVADVHEPQKELQRVLPATFRSNRSAPCWVSSKA
jgi:hypothetical protein